MKKNTPSVSAPVEAQTSCPPNLPLIGSDAPEFTAASTKGTIHFPKDYKGKWVILFSHPADFTPVCTTEFIMFAQLAKEFKKLNTELIGLSVDSLSSHVAWLYVIKDRVKFKKHEHVHIPFPVIADLSTEVARKYGMIHDKANGTKTVRAVFFIDPQAKIRTILYYPASTGRNFDEILRILKSLQLCDKEDISTPADWMPGDDIIRSAPQTLEEAEICDCDNKKTTNAWFLTLEPVNKPKKKK
ncbi:MAG: peroxiredoxin [Lactobacillales bacterium]|jgi:peroxiredoxin (alkyl hydroperoxide reductase subunit C)|nr:peroxiredoxin [Lactobacillales bacterium]